MTWLVLLAVCARGFAVPDGELGLVRVAKFGVGA
jgi:hypothetical protein